MVNRAWDSLNNIVNGYYWLTYSKYTDMNKLEPNSISVSLTQYSRSTDVGWLLAYEKANPEQDVSLLEDEESIILENNENVDTVIDSDKEIPTESSYAMDLNIAEDQEVASQEQLEYMPGIGEIALENDNSLDNLEVFEDVPTTDHSDLTPPAITEPETDILALLPSKHLQSEGEIAVYFQLSRRCSDCC